ncbi:MAG: PilW family protein [Burkholderiaceae bacterium]|jgi:type IV pilus assembly protein PilW|nr:PilW family protein [Burkholderiaceae bacterium]
MNTTVSGFDETPVRAAVRSRRHQRGLSLIELMVAMLIGLLLMLAMVSAMFLSDSQKRTTSAGSEMDQSGDYAVSVLDVALRNAGSGLGLTQQGQSGGLIGCNPGFTGTLPQPFDTLTPGNLRIVPVLIDQNPSNSTTIEGGSDVLLVMSGSGAGGGVTRGVASLDGATLTLSGSITGIVTSSSIAQDQPLALLDQSNNGCAISVITGPDPATTPGGNSLTLKTAPTDTPSIILPLGNLGGGDVQFQLLGVDLASDTLVSYDLLRGSNPSTESASGSAQTDVQPVAGNVVAMQALYGIADGSGKLSKWVVPANSGGDNYNFNTLLGNPSALQSIVAIRVALLLKGNLYEKNDLYNANTAAGASAPPVAVAPPTWFNPVADASPPADLAGIPFPANWQARTYQPTGEAAHYRYRVIEFVVPVRNSMMSLISSS